MRSVKEILANEKFQVDKKNDFTFEGLVLSCRRAEKARKAY